MCLTEDRLIDPNEHVAYKPLATPMPVPGEDSDELVYLYLSAFSLTFVAGLKGKAIHLSGYQETSELWILRRLVRAFGESSPHPYGLIAYPTFYRAIRCRSPAATFQKRYHSLGMQRSRQYQTPQGGTMGYSGSSTRLAVPRSEDWRRLRGAIHPALTIR